MTKIIITKLSSVFSQAEKPVKYELWQLSLQCTWWLHVDFTGLWRHKQAPFQTPDFLSDLFPRHSIYGKSALSFPASPHMNCDKLCIIRGWEALQWKWKHTAEYCLYIHIETFSSQIFAVKNNTSDFSCVQTLNRTSHWFLNHMVPLLFVTPSLQ